MLFVLYNRLRNYTRQF